MRIDICRSAAEQNHIYTSTQEHIRMRSTSAKQNQPNTADHMNFYGSIGPSFKNMGSDISVVYPMHRPHPTS